MLINALDGGGGVCDNGEKLRTNLDFLLNDSDVKAIVGNKHVIRKGLIIDAYLRGYDKDLVKMHESDGKLLEVLKAGFDEKLLGMKHAPLKVDLGNPLGDTRLKYSDKDTEINPFNSLIQRARVKAQYMNKFLTGIKAQYDRDPEPEIYSVLFGKKIEQFLLNGTGGSASIIKRRSWYNALHRLILTSNQFSTKAELDEDIPFTKGHTFGAKKEAETKQFMPPRRNRNKRNQFRMPGRPTPPQPVKVTTNAAYIAAAARKLNTLYEDKMIRLLVGAFYEKQISSEGMATGTSSSGKNTIKKSSAVNSGAGRTSTAAETSYMKRFVYAGGRSSSAGGDSTRKTLI